MNDTCARRGPNPALFLLVPIAFMVGKNAARHRAMHRAAWAAHHAGMGPGAGGPEGGLGPDAGMGPGEGMGPGFGYGPWGGFGPRGGFGRGFRHGFGGWAGRNADPENVQIPPFIDRVLGAWHTQAHQAGSSGEPAEQA